MEQPELPLATRAPTPPSPEGIAGFGRGGSGRRSAGAAGPGPAAGQPPPRSSPAALILKGASAQPAAHPIPSHPRPGPSRSPPPAPRRPGPAVTPGRSGRCWAVGEAQENTLLRKGSRPARVLFSFSFSHGGTRVPSGHLCGERSFHLLENLDADLVFSSHALGKGGQKGSLGWIPSCLSPVLLAGASQATR